MAACLAVAAAPAAADDFFRSSPGPLSASHAELDGQERCNDCHDGGKALSNDKCLSCHDHADLRAQIAAGKGLHASARVAGRKCETCHLEHKGRGFDLLGWRSISGPQGFDHRLAGWPLEGKHAAIDCSACHRSRDRQGLRTYLGEDRLCGSCHRGDQPHGFDKRALMACERCHGESTWKPPKSVLDFDHNKAGDAQMPLEGAHADVSCGKCHPKSQFNLPAKEPADCANCHQSPHGGHLFGTKPCAWCHSPELRSLDKYSFDHARRTRFDLGAHDKLRCYDCHSKQQGAKKPQRACETCHAKDSHHKDRFAAFGSPPQCGTCHPSTSWKPEVFNHDKLTLFVRTGKHRTAPCRACHRGKNPADFERFDAATVGCMGCHHHAKVHDRAFKDSECLRCHQGAGKIELTADSVDAYHGPKSSFPLVKAHAKVPCAKCHVGDEYKDTPAECGARCHKDSLHRGSLGKECSRCHSGGEWAAVRFDHSDDTDWPLEGLHRRVPACADCHPNRQYHDTPRFCSAGPCHAKDDAHKGKLGTACERCHVEDGSNIFDHNRQAAFRLDGAHLKTRCKECHPSIEFKPRPMTCFGCHPEPDVHRGQYGTLCETCHSTRSFGDIKSLHDVGAFSLDGAHDRLQCRQCHKDSRPLAGSGNLCISCHRQDDVHSNSLSPRCGECHTQWAFAPARFDHSTVGCNLTGLHRTLACYDCHKTGSFGGLSAECYGCHRDSALAVTTPDHTTFTACGSCHNPSYWKPGGAGIGTYGRESICR